MADASSTAAVFTRVALAARRNRKPKLAEVGPPEDELPEQDIRVLRGFALKIANI